ncbi:hypothetical protein F5I97DRAFT_1116353 [Phlebopus sp. FC_14]|nr:hypothetical protein F5I97DRAFT_1116353 [Phlebopus sp. FC_14]
MTAILIEMLSQQPINLETPYSSYATVNIIARPEDREPIDAIVVERQSQMTDLTQEIESHVQESQQFHRGLTSAVRRLSPEILSAIFGHCLPKDPPVPSVKDPPLVLTRVCQRWRSVAMATPQLWSSLTISVPRASNASYRFQCDTWLERAKSVPLVLSVWNVSTCHVDGSLLDWLHGLVARCLSFLWKGHPLEGLLTGSSIMELLERLDFDFDVDPFNRWLDFPSIDIASSASKLSYVRMALPQQVNSISRITLPWAQLTTLDMYGLCFADILRLFQICARLQSAQFELPYEDDLQSVIPGSTINHCLRRLSLTELDSRAGGLLFDALVLPSLEGLEVWDYRANSQWPHTQFISFLTRSRCPLKRLDLCGNSSARNYFPEYRALLPSCTLNRLQIELQDTP